MITTNPLPTLPEAAAAPPAQILPAAAAAPAAFAAEDFAADLEAALTGTVVTGALLFAAFAAKLTLGQLGYGPLLPDALDIAAAVMGAFTLFGLFSGLARVIRR